jgi:hypothetical protein
MSDAAEEEFESICRQAFQEEGRALREGFLTDITGDTDWGFVIKAHALVEAALMHLLLARIGEPRLVKILARMDTNAKQGGKTAVLEELKLITKQESNFILRFSTMRNAFAHDIHNMSATILEHVRRDLERAGEFVTALTPVFEATELAANCEIPIKEYISKYPRESLWAAVEIFVRRAIDTAFNQPKSILLGKGPPEQNSGSPKGL